MDKLNLLKLVGNFLTQNSAQNNENSKNSNSSEQSPLSLLQNLIKPQTNQNEKEKDRLIVPAPLQKGLLDAMNSHDEFLRRVNKNNQKC